MAPILRTLALVAVLLLGSCAAQPSDEEAAIATTDVTNTEVTATDITVSGASPSTSVADIPSTALNEEPVVQAFSSLNCAQIESAEDHQWLEEALPSEALEEFESVIEAIAASVAIGNFAEERFEQVLVDMERVSDRADDAPTFAPVSQEAEDAREAELTQRHVAALLDPDLPEAAPRLAREIETSCGSSGVSDGIFKMAELATFMQVIPSDDYCWALSPFSAATHAELTAAAPAAHQTWIDQLGSARDAGDDFAELGTIMLYAQAHCS